METALKVRRLCLVEGQSISEVARQFHLSRNTVDKYLRQSSPPIYNQSQPRQRPQLDAFKNQLTTWIEYDLKRPKRERRTAMRLFNLLRNWFANGWEYD